MCCTEVVLDLSVLSFNAVVVSTLEFSLLFNSCSTYCDLFNMPVSLLFQNKAQYYMSLGIYFFKKLIIKHKKNVVWNDIIVIDQKILSSRGALLKHYP